MHLLPRILSQFPDTEIPMRSAPWRGKPFLLHRCRTYPAFSMLPERTAAVALFLPGFSADPGETEAFPSGYVLLFFLRFLPECFFLTKDMPPFLLLLYLPREKRLRSLFLRSGVFSYLATQGLHLHFTRVFCRFLLLLLLLHHAWYSEDFHCP